MKDFLKHIVVTIITLESRLVLKKYKPRIVAVTGRVGKTSAKDAIASVLASASVDGRRRNFTIRKSKKSFNSEIGVPLTILDCENAWGSIFGWVKNILRGAELVLFRNDYPDILVLEAGVGKPGDIAWIADLITPEVAVMTRIGDVPVHVEYFSSPEAILREKARLVEAVPKGGLVVLNHDDARVMSVVDKCRAEVVTFGFSPDASLRAEHDKVQYHDYKPVGLTFKVAYDDGGSIPVNIMGVFGRQHVYAALAALTVAAHFRVNMVEAAQAIEAWVPAPGRFRLLDGIKDTVILDDTYNSSPAALEAALLELKSMKVKEGARRVAVLGDMLELGKFAIAEHKRLGMEAGSFCDLVVTVGVRARYFAEGALDGGLADGKILQFDDARTAGLYLQNEIRDHDVILIKGSQLIRMERTVEEVMAHPELKEQLLVRQEAEWGRR